MNGRTLLSVRVCDAARLEGGMDDRKLRLSRLQVGLLINFNVSVLKNGLRRIVNSYPDFPYPLRASAASALKGNVS